MSNNLDYLNNNNIYYYNILNDIKKWLLEEPQINLLKGEKGDAPSLYDIDLSIKLYISENNELFKGEQGIPGNSIDYLTFFTDIKSWLLENSQRLLFKGDKGDTIIIEQPPIDYDIINDNIINYINDNKELFKGSTGAQGLSIKLLNMINDRIIINYNNNNQFISDSLRGPTGIQGSQGIQGIQGIQGNTGSLSNYYISFQDIRGINGPPIYIINNINEISIISDLNNYINYIIKYAWDGGSLYKTNPNYLSLNSNFILNRYTCTINNIISTNLDVMTKNDQSILYNNNNGLFQSLIKGDWKFSNKINVLVNFPNSNLSSVIILVNYLLPKNNNNTWIVFSMTCNTAISTNNNLNPIISLTSDSLLYLESNEYIFSMIYAYGDTNNTTYNIINGNCSFYLIK